MGAASSNTGFSFFLPEELHTHLNLAEQAVLRRYRRRTDQAERRAGRAGVVVGDQAVEVVVEHVECFEAQLEADALADGGHLQQRSVQAEGVLPPDLAGAEGIVTRSIRGRRQPGVVAAVDRA